MTTSADLEATNTSTVGVFIVCCVALFAFSLRGPVQATKATGALPATAGGSGVGGSPEAAKTAGAAPSPAQGAALGGAAGEGKLSDIFTKLNEKDGMLMIAMPLIVLILRRLLPHEWKASVIFFPHVVDPLPGCRVFEKFGRWGFTDHRMKRESLEKLMRMLGLSKPTADDQNAAWYKLYRKYSDKSGVEVLQGQYLLLTDVCIVSILFLLVPLLMLVIDRQIVDWTGWAWTDLSRFAVSKGYYVIMGAVTLSSWWAAGCAGRRFTLNVVVEAVQDAETATPQAIAQTMAKAAGVVAGAVEEVARAAADAAKNAVTEAMEKAVAAAVP